MQRNGDPLNMCHLCTINDINNNECISLTQNTLTFKIGFRAFLSAGRTPDFWSGSIIYTNLYVSRRLYFFARGNTRPVFWKRNKMLKYTAVAHSGQGCGVRKKNHVSHFLSSRHPACHAEKRTVCNSLLKGCKPSLYLSPPQPPRLTP